jgi:hypothetical protein
VRDTDPEDEVGDIHRLHHRVAQAGHLQAPRRPGASTTVPSQNLNLDVLMMKSAENWYCFDMADLLQAPKIRRILLQ